MLPNILKIVPIEGNTISPSMWIVNKIVKTNDDRTIVELVPRRHSPEAIFKLSHSDAARSSLIRQSEVITCLYNDSRLFTWHPLLPKLLAEAGKSRQPYYCIEQKLSGIEARNFISNSENLMRMQKTSTKAIGDLHQCTANDTPVDQALYERWVLKPITRIKELQENRNLPLESSKGLDRLSVELQAALVGRTLTTSWIHGDFMPDNNLLSANASTITGIIDWDLAESDHLSQLDLILLFLSTRMLTSCSELGDVVVQLLQAGVWNPYEQKLLNSARLVSDDKLDFRVAILLTWLRHVKSVLKKTTAFLIIEYGSQKILNSLHNACEQ